ncbi:hypothetical protein BsWGS_06531 [Bradybaena similaris]
MYVNVHHHRLIDVIKLATTVNKKHIDIIIIMSIANNVILFVAVAGDHRTSTIPWSISLCCSEQALLMDALAASAAVKLSQNVPVAIEAEWFPLFSVYMDAVASSTAVVITKRTGCYHSRMVTIVQSLHVRSSCLSSSDVIKNGPVATEAEWLPLCNVNMWDFLAKVTTVQSVGEDVPWPFFVRFAARTSLKDTLVVLDSALD